jgi:hypothetical protein
MRGERAMGAAPRNVETRADGRPPEEARSDDPEEQAAAILEDSEKRLDKAAQKSMPKGKA